MQTQKCLASRCWHPIDDPRPGKEHLLVAVPEGGNPDVPIILPHVQFCTECTARWILFAASHVEFDTYMDTVRLLSIPRETLENPRNYEADL